MPDFTLYGIALTLIILGGVRFIQDKTGLSDSNADLLRAIAGMFAFLLVNNAALLEVQFPWFETVFVQVGGAIGTFLMILGYWPEARRVGYRVQGLTAQGLER